MAHIHLVKFPLSHDTPSADWHKDIEKRWRWYAWLFLLLLPTVSTECKQQIAKKLLHHSLPEWTEQLLGLLLCSLSQKEQITWYTEKWHIICQSMCHRMWWYTERMTHYLPKYVSQNVVVHRKSDTFPAQVCVTECWIKLLSKCDWYHSGHQHTHANIRNLSNYY